MKTRCQTYYLGKPLIFMQIKIQYRMHIYSYYTVPMREKSVSAINKTLCLVGKLKSQKPKATSHFVTQNKYRNPIMYLRYSTLLDKFWDSFIDPKSITIMFFFFQLHGINISLNSYCFLLLSARYTFLFVKYSMVSPLSVSKNFSFLAH